MNSLRGEFYFDKPSHEISVWTAGDTGKEKAAAAYKAHGPEFASHLQGGFAVAVWDGPGKRLILARDPLGLQQLYYFQNKKKVIFSSRPSALFEDPSVSKKPDETMLGQFFTGEFLDYETTFYKNIKQVPPAHVLVFHAGQSRQKMRFWSPGPKILRFKDKNEYLEEFYRLFKNSLRSRLQGPSAAGLLLSGGIDSAQICAMAETLRKEEPGLSPLKSICLVGEGFLAEEKALLDALIARYQTGVEILDHHSQSQNIFELYLEPGEMPSYDAFLTVPLLLQKLAQKGCATLLTGYGANEFSNLMEFGYLEDLLLSFRFQKLSRETRRFAKCIHAPERDVQKMIFMETLREKTPSFVRKIIRAGRMGRRSWLKPEFRKKIAPTPSLRLRPFKKLSENETYQALFEPVIPLNLAQMAEAAEKYGLKTAHPFMDLPLIEFFLSVPIEIKMEGGYRKNFTQRALAPIMPTPVKTEDDERVFIPFKADDTRARMELPRIQAHLSDPEKILYEYADYKEVQKLALPENPNLDYPLLWRLVRLSNWLEANWGKTVLINDIKER